MKRLFLYSLILNLGLPLSALSQNDDSFKKLSNGLNISLSSKNDSKEDEFVSKFFNTQKKSSYSINPLKCEGDEKLFGECVPSVPNSVFDFSKKSINVTMALSGAACYNNPKTCNESTPDIQNICDCLNIYGGRITEDKKSHDSVDKKNLGDEIINRGNARVQECSKKEVNQVIPEIEKCYEVLKNKPEDKRCLEIVKNADKLITSELVKKTNPAPAITNETKYSCLGIDKYIEATHIPTTGALLAIRPPESAKRNEIAAHQTVLLEMLSGRSLNNIINDSGSELREVASKMLLSTKSKELEIFIRKNQYWTVLLNNSANSSEKKKILEKFTDIFGSQSPEYRAKELLRFMSEPETVAAMNSANKNEKEEASINNKMLKEILALKPDAIYSDFGILSKMYKIKDGEEVNPSICGFIADEAEGNKPVYFGKKGHSFHTEKNVLACQSMYQNICQGNQRWRSGQAQLTESEKEVIEYAIAKNEEDAYYRDLKKSYHKQFAEKICNETHSLGKGFEKLGRSVTFNEFKQVVCSGKEIDNKKINYKFSSDEIKESACASSGNADQILGQLYIAAFDENNGLEIDDIKQMSIENTNPVVFKKKAKEERFYKDLVSTTNSRIDEDGDNFCGILCSLGKMRENSKTTGVVASATSNPSSTPSFIDGLASGMTKAATTISGPAVKSNVQSYMNGVMPITSVLPADLNNADTSQLSYAKRSVDNGISNLEKRLDNYEKKEEQSYSASQNQEINLLKKQIEELRQQSELLKSQLDKEKETKVADKAVESPAAAAGSRSLASTGDYKSSVPHVSSATQQAANNQNLQPSKIFENSYSDGSFHSVPTLGSSKSIDSKAFNSRSSNDALLSIYTDKTVSNLVDSVASSSNSNILVVGNALEMQEATVKDKKFQTKEIVIDQNLLEQVRSNPESLKSLIEENKIKNHVGILTLKTGESQLNYIMRKDDAGKLVILPLNIARKVTLDSLKNELNRH